MSLSEGVSNPYLGMGGFPNLPFSSSFPISQAFPSLPVRQDWPSSSDGAMSKTNKHPGSSGEVQINYQAQLRLWEQGQHNNILDGDLMIIASSELVQTSLYTMPLLNITDANLYLKDQYERGQEFFREMKASTQPDHVRLVRLLEQTPSHRWHYLPDIARGLSDHRDRAGSLALCFLTPHCIESFFNFYGFARGEVPDTAIKAIALARGNVVDSIKNYWGNFALPGMNLWLVRKRVFDTKEGSFGRYAFVPVACYNKPEYAERAYVDITGHVQVGSCIYVGKVIRWVENFNSTPDVLDVLLGNKTISDTIRVDGSIRIKMCSLPGLKTNFIP